MTLKTRPANTPRPAAEHPGNGTPSRRTARVVGFLFLAAMLTYGPGSGITASILGAPDSLANVAANRTTFTLGAALMLVNSAVVVAIGVLLFPTLKRHNERIALGYYASRVFEAVLLTLGVVGLLSLTTVSEEYLRTGAADAAHLEALGALAVQINDVAYQVAMAALGLGSLFFCFLLYQTRLVPRTLAVWGFAGYAVFLTGALLEIFGFGVGLLLSVPGGLFEVCFGIWLMVKGFAPSATAPATLPADAPAHGFVTVRPRGA